MSARPPATPAEMTPVLNPLELILMLLAVAGGAFAAAVLVPSWLPGLTSSLMGDEPKAFWYLARASGLAAYLLLWLSLAFGLIVSNKLARLWNGGPAAVDLHQFTTWLAVAFMLLHALILLGDHFVRATLAQVLTPFAYAGYQPVWVGFGQIGFYLTLIVGASFYVRKRIGYRTWRTLHYLSFVIYSLLLAHGIFAGTDTSTPAVATMYFASGIAVYFLLVVRIFDAVRAPRSTHADLRSSASPTAAHRG